MNPSGGVGRVPSEAQTVAVEASLGARIKRVRAPIIGALDDPQTPAALAVSLGLLALIYASVTAVVIEFRYPDIAIAHAELFHVADLVILAAFGGELLLRIVCYQRPLRYLLSWMGIIDLLAVVPGVVGLVFPASPNLAWPRSCTTGWAR